MGNPALPSLSQGEPLKPDEGEGCSLVANFARVGRLPTLIPRFDHKMIQPQKWGPMETSLATSREPLGTSVPEVPRERVMMKEEEQIFNHNAESGDDRAKDPARAGTESTPGRTACPEAEAR